MMDFQDYIKTDMFNYDKLEEYITLAREDWRTGYIIVQCQEWTHNTDPRYWPIANEIFSNVMNSMIGIPENDIRLLTIRFLEGVYQEVSLRIRTGTFSIKGYDANDFLKGML